MALPDPASLVFAKNLSPNSSDKAALRKAMKAPEVTEFITDRMEILLERMWDLALGVVVLEEKVDKDTGDVIPRIFRLAPDRQALQWLIENGIGKVPNRVEMTGADGGPVQVTPWMPVAAGRAAGLLPDPDADADTFEGEATDVTPG